MNTSFALILPGLGAFASPLVSTQFVAAERWSLFYLASLGISIVNIIILCFVFRFQRQNGDLAFCYSARSNLIP